MAKVTSASPIDLSLDALEQLIRDCVPEVNQIIQDFPTPNQQLQYPTVTISHSQQPAFTNEMPYELEGCGKTSDTKIGIVWITGQWDYKIQLDIWARSVPERDFLFQKIFNAFDAQIEPMGLSVQIPDYFGLWGRFEVENFAHTDGEQASQRGEWRTKISLLASVKQAQEQAAYRITKPIVVDQKIVDTDLE